LVEAEIPSVGAAYQPKYATTSIWPQEDERPHDLTVIDYGDFRDNYLPSVFGEPAQVTSAKHQVFNPVIHGGVEKNPGGHVEGPPVFQNFDESTMPRTNLGTSPITHVYRGMTEAEWNQAQQRGYISSDMRGVIAGWEGTNAGASAGTAVSYLPRNGKAIVAQIAVRPEDGWFTSDADDYLRTRNQVPLDRVLATTGLLNMTEGHVTEVGPVPKPTSKPSAETPSVAEPIPSAGRLGQAAAVGGGELISSLRGANPHFDPNGYKIDLADPTLIPPELGYNYNCVNAVTAFELRMRGQDVSARPVHDSIAQGDTTDFLAHWLKPDGSVLDWTDMVHTGDAKATRDLVKSWPDGGRGFVMVQWARDGGHIFVAANVGGQAKFYEPQGGQEFKVRDFRDVEDDLMYAFRMDDLIQASNMKDYVE
jgi:hypothetical protein